MNGFINIALLTSIFASSASLSAFAGISPEVAQDCHDRGQPIVAAMTANVQKLRALREELAATERDFSRSMAHERAVSASFSGNQAEAAAPSLANRLSAILRDSNCAGAFTTNESAIPQNYLQEIANANAALQARLEPTRALMRIEQGAVDAHSARDRANARVSAELYPVLFPNRF